MHFRNAVCGAPKKGILAKQGRDFRKRKLQLLPHIQNLNISIHKPNAYTVKLL